eukprot:12883565-Prorocentrum_lima.AAC.1
MPPPHGNGPNGPTPVAVQAVFRGLTVSAIAPNLSVSSRTICTASATVRASTKSSSAYESTLSQISSLFAT